jgi:hypothetical protein
VHDVTDVESRFTLAMKKHNHYSGVRPIQYDDNYSRHSRGKAKAKERVA